MSTRILIYNQNESKLTLDDETKKVETVITKAKIAIKKEI